VKFPKTWCSVAPIIPEEEAKDGKAFEADSRAYSLSLSISDMM
jgi:hypothetical protein